ncbi:MAG TPA: ATP-binding protein [Phycisphaerales bacterium]|nr:ATP-binding protein [Phycisphaerales bacterium]
MTPDTLHAEPGPRPAPDGAGSLRPEELPELLAAFNDVTARLHASHEALRAQVARLQEELVAAGAELERSRRLAALGEMAAGIAHEVRNPLGAIRLYAGLLEHDLADRPRDREAAGKILASVRGLDAVVGDVLAFARETRAVLAPVRLGELARAAAEEALAGRGHVPGVVFEGDPAASAPADAGLLHRALVNLVRNAAEAMEQDPGPEPRLTIRWGTRPAGRDRGAGTAYIGVADTGPGLAPDVLARMFNPFFTTRATGTGLGLAIVHRIVEAHGGRVVVENQQRGALVEIELPPHPPSETPAPPRSGARGQAHGRRAALSQRRKEALT